MEPERFTSIDFTNFQMFYAKLLPYAYQFFETKWPEYGEADILVSNVFDDAILFSAVYEDEFLNFETLEFDLNHQYLMNEEFREEVLDQLRIQNKMKLLEEQLKAKMLAEHEEAKQRQLYEILKQKFDK